MGENDIKKVQKIYYLITLVLSGCELFEKGEVCSQYGMTITMDKGFVEKDILSATYYLESSDSIMIAIKEEF